MVENHSYEEIRDVIVEILTRKVSVSYPPSQWGNLTTSIAEIFHRRSPPRHSGQWPQVTSLQLSERDAELARDIFWDLFRQGAITLGLNDANPNWPHFRLSHFGEKILNSGSPWRFHDASSYIEIVRTAVPDIKQVTVSYLEEASAAFYSGCFLACCVMLGVAAENEFLRLVQVAIDSAQHGATFKVVAKEPMILGKIEKFRNLLKPIVPSLSQRSKEGLGANFDAIQSVLRVARNDAGHPSSAAVPSREQVFVYLQLFVPFARQLRYLRDDMAGNA